MNEKKLPEKPDRGKRIRNIIAGTVVWTAAVAIVVFIVLDPSESVEMQIGTGLSDQEVVADLSDNSSELKIEQAEVDSSVENVALDTESESQAITQSEIVDSKPQTSSIVYESDTADTSEPVETAEPVQTATVSTETETRTTTATATDVPTVTEETSRTRTSPTTKPSESALFIQVAAFSKVENAQLKRKEISKALFPVRVLKAEDGMNLVLVGPYLTESEAKKVKSELNSTLQLTDSFLKYAEIEPTKVAMTESTTGTTTQSVTTTTTTSAEKSEVVNGWYVRVGAYKNLGNAKTSRLRVEKLQLSTIVTQEEEFNVLMVGPFQDENTAQIAKTRISLELKIKDAYLVRVGS